MAMALIDRMEQSSIPRNDIIYTNLIERLLSADKIQDAIGFYIRVHHILKQSADRFRPTSKK